MMKKNEKYWKKKAKQYRLEYMLEKIENHAYKHAIVDLVSKGLITKDAQTILYNTIADYIGKHIL